MGVSMDVWIDQSMDRCIYGYIYTLWTEHVSTSYGYMDGIQVWYIYK